MKRTTVKTSQKTLLYTYSYYVICTVIHCNYIYAKLFLRYINSSLFSQIRLQMFWQKWSPIANQVTYSKNWFFPIESWIVIYYQLSMNPSLIQQLNHKLLPSCTCLDLVDIGCLRGYSKLHSVLIANILIASHL